MTLINVFLTTGYAYHYCPNCQCIFPITGKNFKHPGQQKRDKHDLRQWEFKGSGNSRGAVVFDPNAAAK